jgi:hypothetical protein
VELIDEKKTEGRKSRVTVPSIKVRIVENEFRCCTVFFILAELYVISLLALPTGQWLKKGNVLCWYKMPVSPANMIVWELVLRLMQ